MSTTLPVFSRSLVLSSCLLCPDFTNLFCSSFRGKRVLSFPAGPRSAESGCTFLFRVPVPEEGIVTPAQARLNSWTD